MLYNKLVKKTVIHFILHSKGKKYRKQKNVIMMFTSKLSVTYSVIKKASATLS